MVELRQHKTPFYFWATFIRAQISSIISTCIDWTVTFILTDWLNVWYVISTITGATSGGITNFLLNRHWTFYSGTDHKKYNTGNDSEIKGQFVRYIVVWSGSILLNTLGTIFFTEITHLNYLLSKAITAIIVAFSFNFLMQKKYVFRFTT